GGVAAAREQAGVFARPEPVGPCPRSTRRRTIARKIRRKALIRLNPRPELRGSRQYRAASMWRGSKVAFARAPNPARPCPRSTRRRTIARKVRRKALKTLNPRPEMRGSQRSRVASMRRARDQEGVFARPEPGRAMSALDTPPNSRPEPQVYENIESAPGNIWPARASALDA